MATAKLILASMFGLAAGARISHSTATSLKTAALSAEEAVEGQAPTTFKHPGVLISGKQLDFMRRQVAAKVGPIYDAYLKATRQRIGSLDYQVRGPPASGIVECGSYSRPDFGCTNESEDSSAAVLQSYLWAVSGHRRYGENAVRIMGTWQAGLRGHNNSNAPLQAGWSAAKWSKAAELMSHTNFGWDAASRQAFRRTLTDIYLPRIWNGAKANGNWELTMIDAMFGIAVLTENRTIFDRAATFWRQRLPAYIYVASDGPQPRPAPRGVVDWNQTVFNASVSGIMQETCRDLPHTCMGVGALTNAAETAYIQGLDLYSEQQVRIVAGLEFHAKLLLGARPPLVCQGTVIGGRLGQIPTFEIAYNHYARRKHLSLPFTQKYIEVGIRTHANPYDRMITTYETLTHGESP